MKAKKTPVIVSLVLTVLCVIGAVVCFLLPKAASNSPIEVTESVGLSYSSYFRGHELTGKIKNVSDGDVVLYSDNSIVLYFNVNGKTSRVVFKDSTLRLKPGEEFSLRDTENLFEIEGDVRITKVNITVDGTAYTVYGGQSTKNILMIVFIFLAIVFLIVTIAAARGVKTQAARAKAIDELVTRIGGGTVVRGILNDKNENKKAAAKTAGWAIGGILSAVFLGAGVFRTYSGSAQSDFIVNDRLYILNGGTSASNLQLITMNEFPVESVTVKKNNVIIQCADKIRSIKLFADKKSSITAEQLAAKMNDIFVNAPDPVPVQTANAEVASSAADDPFASDNDVTAQTEASAPETAAPEIKDGE